MSKPTKIYLINRDRALEIMWYMDSLYDTNKHINFWMVKDKVKYSEWLITQMYFLNWYTADKVIEKLNTNYPLWDLK